MKDSPQNFERKDKSIESDFSDLLAENLETLEENLKFAWSNWGFGQEDLASSADRLQKMGIEYVELHGNRYSSDLGYDPSQVKEVLDSRGIEVSGICGMFSPERELSSDKAWIRQNAIDYIKRNLKLGEELGAEYFLVVPGAVGRPDPIDEYEMDRSVKTLRKVADKFLETDIKGAVEPIRSAEVSFCNTFSDAEEYIERLDHPGVQWINGDIYHMSQEESHIAETIREYEDRLVNLHLADSNRRALGRGMINLDIILKALYLDGYNREEKFITAEPLGPGGDPYPAKHAKHDKRKLDKLVEKTVKYLRKRERVIKNKDS